MKGQSPKIADLNGPLSWDLTGGLFRLACDRFKPATDVSLIVEASGDLTHWVEVLPGQVRDNKATETLVVEADVSTIAMSFFRLRAE